MKIDNHEKVFTSLYSRLRGGAMRIARQNTELAEDLLHDAFIQFTSAQPSLDEINNVEAYLYGLIKNLHLSHLRKKLRRDRHALTIIDFETLRLGLKTEALLDNLQTQEELKRICYFLCLRKESSKSASVMILRFFLGYFPSEIALVMRATPQVVKVRLNTARNETKTVTAEPETIKKIEDRITPELVVNKTFRSNVELALALREMIFRSTNGVCLTDEQLNQIYFFNEHETIDTKTLAHIVSCRKCLDKINVLLNLLPLSERYAVDFIGKDKNDPGNPSGNGGGMSEDLDEKVLLNLRRSAREVYEHEPRELFLAIDGEIKATGKIERPETELKLELKEIPQFVEIVSEQGVRLAFVSLGGEESEAGEAPRQFMFALSEERKLTIELAREPSGLILHACYEAPHFAEAKALAAKIREDLPLAEFLAQSAPPKNAPPIFGGFLNAEEKKDSVFDKLRRFLSSINQKTAFAGVALATITVGALLFNNFFIAVPQVSATELMQKAAGIERASETATENVIYRVVDFEEKQAGALSRKGRIEIFNDAARKLLVRRLFDENNRLVAGEWRRRDGVSTVYAVGKTSALKLYKSDKEIVEHDPENIWQISLSTAGFESIVGSPENVSAKQSGDEYRIDYRPQSETGVVNAALFLNKNLRADKMLLAVNQAGARREFVFTEAVYEQKPRASVENAAFEPNAEFLKNAFVADKTAAPPGSETQKSGAETPTAAAPETAPENAAAPIASPELEIKVLELLNGVNALSGEQIRITKTATGKIQITGIVDARRRRDEILGALAEVRSNPAISVNIQTAEEAAKNKAPQKPDGALESITVESRNSIPASDLLRDHFAAQGVAEEKIDAEIRRFASQALAKSAQVRRAALQMKQIADRFSAAELDKMDDAAKNNWRRLVRQNAAALAQNSESLRSEMRAIGVEAGGAGGNVDAASDAELVRAARRLFELSLAVDRDARSSFSSGGGRGVPVKSASFAANLGELINLARQLK